MADDQYGPVLLALGQYATFTSFLPSLREIRNADPGDAALVADLRTGEVVASAVSLTIGGVASAMSGSPLCFFVAALVCAAMVVLYEWTLNNSPFGPTKEQTA